MLYCILLYIAIVVSLSYTAFAQQYRALCDGVELASYIKYLQASTDTLRLPALVRVLRIDGTKAIVRIVHAKDAAIGLETTSQMAKRYDALAAVNGGFFVMKGITAGDAAGVLQIDGRLLSEPYKERVACGLSDRSGQMYAVFGHLRWRGEVVLGHSFTLFGTALQALLPSYRIAGINRARDSSEIVLYTPEFHRTTLTNTHGVELVIAKHIIVAIRDNMGSSVIPEDGFVVSCSGAAAAWARKYARIGMFAHCMSEIEGSGLQQTRRFRNAQYIVGGVSMLVVDGVVHLTWQREEAPADFALMRHPRTAIGRRADGRILLVTVDGRSTASVGMTLQELAELMQELGATEAINLDGGGSTTMVVRGEVINTPADPSGERPVSDAILVFPRVQDPKNRASTVSIVEYQHKSSISSP
ncbi:MAG: phosphodiester glycosidase family protein [Bacteroidota bacterium]|nr:phosphodiester glycosidase family protein [Candidatus Kapabacteria bacterium]MDW8219959.1 phosphodiester glycosidase family protein [Bacteroidota bacterium]